MTATWRARDLSTARRTVSASPRCPARPQLYPETTAILCGMHKIGLYRIAESVPTPTRATETAMIGSIHRTLSTLALAFAVAGPAGAQPFVQFDFNASNATPNINLSAGTPGVVIVGTPTSSFADGTGDNGANSTDPVGGGMAYQLTAYP